MITAEKKKVDLFLSLKRFDCFPGLIVGKLGNNANNRRKKETTRAIKEIGLWMASYKKPVFGPMSKKTK